MKAITIIQPWASLLVLGKKRLETRSWRVNYRGDILIHAGKTRYPEIREKMPAKRWIREALEVEGLEEGSLPVGALIGRAKLVNCVAISEEIRDLIREQEPDEYAFGDFTPGRYAWVMTEPVWLKDPIPANGKQRLWEWEGELPWK